MSVVAVLALLGGCSRDSLEPPAAPMPADGEAAAAAPATPPSTRPAPAPDVLPDPEVAPGACEIRTYTPPTAVEPHDGRLCRPREDQRDVAVVLVHGGGGVEGDPSSLAGWARRLNAEGYVTFQVSYHLFSPSGSTTPVFPLPEQNVKAAVQYLRGAGNALGIAKDRIAVQGHSAGARIGAVAYTSSADPWFDGPELWPDIPDRVDAFVGFYHPYDGTMMFSSTYFGGDDDRDDPVVQLRWAKADSLSRAARADAPALFVNGERDWDVIDEQQDEFVQGLRTDGQRAEAVLIEGGAHGFDLGGSRLTRLGEEAATHVLRFLNTVFPQSPPRATQTEDVDLSNAPTGTGSTPTTVRTRPRRTRAGSSPTTSSPRPSSTTETDGSTTVDTDESGPTSSHEVSTTSPPSTSPSSTVPSTTEPPVTTTLAVTTTAAPTTTTPPPATAAP